MREQDRENQAAYEAMGIKETPDEYPKVDHGTPVTYVQANKEWEARWPTNVRLPVAGEWIIFETEDGEEKSYAVKSVDWFFTATGGMAVKIGLK